MRKSKAAIIDARNTLWGKALAVAMAIIFAASTLMLAPLASAAYGEPEEPVADEIIDDLTDEGEDLGVVGDVNKEEDNTNDIVDEEKDEGVPGSDNTVLDTQSIDEEIPEVLADENAVAQVGDVTYETLQAAIIAAQNGATVFLVSNTDENRVSVNKSITLDLNGFTLSGSIENSGELVIKDSSATETGTIVCGNGGNALGNYGRVTMFSGTIKSMSSGMSCVQNNGEMVIYGGSFYGNEPSGPAVTNNSANGYMTIYGGFFSSKYTGNVNDGYAHAAIQTLNGAHTTIKDGTFIGQHTAAYVSEAGSYLTINGGTFEGTARSAVYYNQTDCNVYITGGTFLGGLAVIGGSITKSPGVKIVGGKFNKIVNGVVDESGYNMSRFLVEGVIQLPDGTITDGNVAQVEDSRYETLQAAVDAIEGSGTITMVGDIKDMTIADIVNIPAGKDIILDMAGHSITVASDFTGRPIANAGTLTITGNGTIDSSNGNKGYGAVRNDGTLTVMNGRYIGNVYGDGSAIRNGIGSTLTVQDGYFAGTSAIYNVGEATLYKGEFVTLACSGCGTPWAYALNNRNEGGVSGTMQILPASDADVVVHGSQGALAAAGGANVYVKGGTFYTYPCNNGHSGNAFYALYVSGKADMVATCVIDGGNFSTTGANSCAYIENTNPDDNGGEPGKAIVRINGGSFDQGPAPKLVNFSNKNGSMLEVSGGEFKGKNIDSVEPYVIPTMQLQDNGNDVYTVVPKEVIAKIGDVTYSTLEAAIEAAQDGETVLLLKDVNAATVSKAVKVDLGGNTINKIDVVGDGVLRAVTATLKNGTIDELMVNNRGKIDLWNITAPEIKADNGLMAIQGGTYRDITVSGSDGKLYVTSGTFNGTIVTDDSNGRPTMQIKGGSFAQDVTEYCDKGFEAPATPNANEMYVVHQIKKVTDEAVEPTCTETGLTEGTHCSECGKVQMAQTAVDSKGHSEVVDPAVEATCTETGLTEGKHCSVCDEILNAQTETPALGHEWGEWTITIPAQQGIAGQQQRACNHDATHVETQAIPALSAAQQPTTPSNNTPTTIVDDNTPLAPTTGTTAGTLATNGVAPADNTIADETIDDDATPLVVADDEAAAGETITDEANPLSAAQKQETEGSMLWIIVPVIVVAAGLILFLIGRRRKQREDQPYMRY